MLNNLGMGNLGNMTHKNNGDKYKNLIDEEIKDILKKAVDKSKEILIEHTNLLIK
jgi:ATP-dependent Zn protease